MSIRSGLVFVTLVSASAFVSCRADDTVRQLQFEPTDTKRDRTVPVKVYLPQTSRPVPVILFSHGLGGSRDNNAYLGTHWAKAGFVGVFMQHAGSDNEVWKSAKGVGRLTALKNAVSVKASQDRFADIPFVIDRLEAWNQQKGHALFGKLDTERIGMCGHSYGAVTTLAVAGRKYPLNRSFAEDRIDAFFAMSPQPGKGVAPSRAFGHLKKPILCMTGTNDRSPIDLTLTPETRQQVYKALPAGDKYQLVLDKGEHFAFGDSSGLRTRRRNPKHHPAVQQISLQFWNAYLKDNAEAKTWLQSRKPVTATGLSSADTWQWK